MMNHKKLNWTFSTLGCPEASMEEIIGLCQEFELKQIELRTVNDRVDLPTLFAEKYGTPEAMQKEMEKTGIHVVSLDTSLKLVGNTISDRESFLEFIPWAKALGTPLLRVFDGGTFAPELSDSDLENALDTIRWWRAFKSQAAYSGDMAIETHDCLTASNAVLQLQSALNEAQSILWDTHHTWKKAGEPVEETWAKIKPFVKHVHVKDSISKPSNRHPFTYVNLGEGEFDLKTTVDLLESENFQGPVSIEWERKWHPYLEPVSVALQSARQMNWW